MKQISIRQLVKQSKDIEKFLPCEVTRDGEVIATMYGVKQRKLLRSANGELLELPLSKAKQARHSW